MIILGSVHWDVFQTVTVDGSVSMGNSGKPRVVGSGCHAELTTFFYMHHGERFENVRRTVERKHQG